MAIGSFFNSIGEGFRTASERYNRSLNPTYDVAMREQENKQIAAQQEAQAQQEFMDLVKNPNLTPEQKLQEAAKYANVPGVMEYMQAAMKPADVPASIKEFQAVQAMTPEQRAAFQAMQNPITPYQQEQLKLERAKLESGADFQRMQANQRAQALELQARALEQAGRRQEAAALRAEAKAVATVEPRKLSATEQKEFYEAEDRASAATGVIGALNDALLLNDKAFSGFTAETRAFLNRVPGVGAFIPDEGATATTELNNIILSQALESLKVTFGAAPTEGERKILLDLQASVDKTPAERKRILERALTAAQRREKSARAKMEGITTGGIYGRQVEAQEPVAPTPTAGGITPTPDQIKIMQDELRRRGAM
jgi:hypothetical protein